MYLIIGLGNPGSQYAKNRHNIGFMFIDALVEAQGFRSAGTKRFQSLTFEGTISDHRVILIKPQTFMNLSGHAVQQAMNFYKVAPDHVIVFHDELDLDAGKFRVKTGGGNAGHNGLKSITQHIGPNFVRARMGIGHPGDKGLVHDHVLSDFAKSDAEWVTGLIKSSIEALPILLGGQTEAYQNEVMRLAPKPKFDPKIFHDM